MRSPGHQSHEWNIQGDEFTRAKGNLKSYTVHVYRDNKKRGPEGIYTGYKEVCQFTVKAKTLSQSRLWAKLLVKSFNDQHSAPVGGRSLVVFRVEKAQ